MNDNAAENILQTDDRKKILNPVILAALVFILLCGGVICIGIRNPNFFIQIRDLIVFLAVTSLFFINVFVGFLCIKLSSVIRQARDAMKSSLNRADRTIDNISDEVNQLIQTVLEPVLGCQSWLSGIKQAFLSLRMKGKYES